MSEVIVPNLQNLTLPHRLPIKKPAAPRSSGGDRPSPKSPSWHRRGKDCWILDFACPWCRDRRGGPGGTVMAADRSPGSRTAGIGWAIVRARMHRRPAMSSWWWDRAREPGNRATDHRFCLRRHRRRWA